ncbi:hypothetical protein YC2023_089508 [Brassica napus]
MNSIPILKASKSRGRILETDRAINYGRVICKYYDKFFTSILFGDIIIVERQCPHVSHNKGMRS